MRFTQYRAAIIAGLAIVATAPAALAQTAPPTATTTSPTTTATNPAPPPPSLHWNLFDRRCWTTITKRETPKRRCGMRSADGAGGVVYLHWRQQAHVSGRLTQAGQPIADAPITLTWTILGQPRPSGEIPGSTHASGRFTIPLPAGPSRLLTVTYTPASGDPISVARKLKARAYLRFDIGQLTAGENGHFSGVVLGGHIPENLYIQFWYLDGRAGWQPFANLARVTRRSGHWSANVPIPHAAGGYRYYIKASVVASPSWPWLHTESRVLTRVVARH